MNEYPIKQTTWVCSDGLKFETEKEANVHEEILKFLSTRHTTGKVQELPLMRYATKDFVLALIENENIRTNLNKLIKKALKNDI